MDNLRNYPALGFLYIVTQKKKSAGRNLIQLCLANESLSVRGCQVTNMLPITKTTASQVWDSCSCWMPVTIIVHDSMRKLMEKPIRLRKGLNQISSSGVIIRSIIIGIYAVDCILQISVKLIAAVRCSGGFQSILINHGFRWLFDPRKRTYRQRGKRRTVLATERRQN